MSGRSGPRRLPAHRALAALVVVLVAVPAGGQDVLAQGTATLVRDINTLGAGSGATPLTPAGGAMLVSACQADGQRSILAVGGPEDELITLTTVGSCEESAVRWALTVGERAFFTLGAGWADLWVTDGTPEGTTTVANLWMDEPGVDLGGVLYLEARDRTSGGGLELWRSDGTADGTYRLRDIRAGENGSWPEGLTVVGDRLFFAATTRSAGRELWMSDGSELGTVLVRDIHPVAGADPSDLTEAGGSLFFAADDGSTGRELWRSDGTADGTRRVRNIRPGSASSAPQQLTAADGRLFFSANDGIHGRELWSSDGTSAGTP